MRNFVVSIACLEGYTREEVSEALTLLSGREDWGNVLLFLEVCDGVRKMRAVYGPSERLALGGWTEMPNLMVVQKEGEV